MPIKNPPFYPTAYGIETGNNNKQKDEEDIMPNWMTNEVTIEGEPKVINQIWKLIMDANPTAKEIDGELILPDGEHGEILGALMPEPDDYESEKGWARDKWGTKWDVTGEFYNRGDGIDMFFQSAWGAPDGVYQHLINTYKCSVSAIYEEAGMEMCGRWRGEWEEGGGEGGYDEYEWGIKGRTELRGEVPSEYHYLRTEKAGELLYAANEYIKSGWAYEKVVGLMKGGGEIEYFGELADYLDDEGFEIEYLDGGFYMTDYSEQEMMEWMNDNQDKCVKKEVKKRGGGVGATL